MLHVQFLFPALLAHDNALNNAGVLHRDIVRNILITEGRGILIDWDLLKHVLKPSKCDKARQPTRMVSTVLSAALVMNKAAPHMYFWGQFGIGFLCHSLARVDVFPQFHDSGAVHRIHARHPGSQAVLRYG